jgi:hypothetical protein
MKTSGRFWVAVTVVAALLSLFSPASSAVTQQQAYTANFDADQPGQPPATGGANQPTVAATNDPSCSVLVQREALGLVNQPVVTTAVGTNHYAGVGFEFAPITHGIVRTEVTASVERFVDADFLQAADADNDFYTLLVLSVQGEIRADLNGGDITLGHYAPYQPFRIRMDINLDTMTASVVVDDEMNGFFDDVLYTGLPFADDNGDLQGVRGVYALMGVAETTPVSAAYDDFVTTIGASGDAMAGDVDSDGNVDRDDVKTIMHSILNGSMPSQGDMDGDGKFTTHDFLEVLCKAGGLGQHCSR